MTVHTTLFYTPDRYAEYAVGTTHNHFGRWIQITGIWMREDLGQYFEISFEYLN